MAWLSEWAGLISMAVILLPLILYVAYYRPQPEEIPRIMVRFVAYVFLVFFLIMVLAAIYFRDWGGA